MKNPFVVFLLIVLNASLYAGQETVYIQDLATVVFPGKPEYHEEDGYNYYYYKDKRFTYQVIISGNQLTAPEELDELKLYAYYDDYRQGYIEAMDGDFIRFQNYWIDELIGQEMSFEITRNLQGNKPEIWHGKYMLINNTLITCFITGYKRYEEELEKTKEEYFSTFHIVAGKDKRIQVTDTIPEASYENDEMPASSSYNSYNDTYREQREQDDAAFRHTLMIGFFAFAIFIGLILGLLLLRYLMNRSYQKKIENKNITDTHEPH